jgi:N-acetylglucosaminyldiphosphoundecaprenol N-acetyl-beta-D-mannosaminyltransferase
VSQVVGSPGAGSTALLGVDCFRGDVDAAAAAVLARARSGLGGYACLCNAHVLMIAQRNPAVRAALNGAWAVFPDGAPVAWMMPRSTTQPKPRRIGGPDLMPRVIELSRTSGLRHGFYGSLHQTLAQLTDRLRATYPGVEIPITIAPPFGELDDQKVREDIVAIREAEVDILWIGLGAPRQELWMARYSTLLGPTVAVGVGAAFDFSAGVKERAPRWMQRAGLEWAHRLGTEPLRLGRRYVVTNSQFLVAASKDIVSRRSRL